MTYISRIGGKRDIGSWLFCKSSERQLSKVENWEEHQRLKVVKDMVYL